MQTPFASPDGVWVPPDLLNDPPSPGFNPGFGEIEATPAAPADV
jgi:hypothetical protein